MLCLTAGILGRNLGAFWYGASGGHGESAAAGDGAALSRIWEASAAASYRSSASASMLVDRKAGLEWMAMTQSVP